MKKIIVSLVITLAIISLFYFWPILKAPQTSEKDLKSGLDISSQGIRNFHYQLQGVRYANLKGLKVDFLVVDIDDANLSPVEIVDLKNSGKTVLSYLSIGEAEDYRDYWQLDWKVGEPSFIDEENPNWQGNFKVRYWQAEWHKIILEKVRKIAFAGYDGVYLDIIDAYEYYEDRGRDTAAAEMVDFVRKIRDAGRKINSDFLIVPQNSPELYELAEYKKIINGLGKEDIWYSDNQNQNNEEIRRVLQFLDAAVKDGKFVLAIDYPVESSKICDFYEKCRSHNFLCTVSNRDLSETGPITCTNR